MSRWGSASERGNLNFNYKLLFLPLEVADYVIVHELCHLAEFNHSPAFWRLVERACPTHRALRQALRRIERVGNVPPGPRVTLGYDTTPAF